MFKHKKAATLLASLFLLAGCGGGETDTRTKVRLQVWGPAEEKVVYETLAAKFQKEHEDINFIVNYGDVGEPDAAKNVLGDVSTAADIFIYPDDQIPQMASKGVLAKLPNTYKNKVIERDSPSAVDAATYAGDGEMYGFPLTADNGYFLVYNKAFLTETDVETLEGIMAKTTAEHQLVVDLGNSYYSLSFIQYISEINYDPITMLHTTNFNDAKSLDALEGIIDILRPRKDNGFVSVDFNGGALDDLSDANGNKVIAGVTGNWNIAKLKENLGENLGTAKLPTFKSKAGETVQWGSFAGSKLLGVKSSSKNLQYALMFADFISDEVGQMLRYTTNGWGPSNKNVAADEALAGELGLLALAAQAPYAIPQGKSVGGKFWENGGLVGTFLLDGPASETSPQTLQAVLDAFVDAITK